MEPNPLPPNWPFPPGFELCKTGYRNTINFRASSRYPKWGFVIFRGTYGDDPTWEKLVKLLNYTCELQLRRRDQYEILGPDLVWTIVEDREALEDKPKSVIREKFREWAAQRSVERDGEGAESDKVGRKCPRFRYCVYIDTECLESVTAKWMPMLEPYWGLRGQVIVIDGTHGRHDEDVERPAPPPPPIYDDDDSESGNSLEDEEDEELEAIEGDTNQDVGWTYVNVFGLVQVYDDLGFDGEDWSTWENLFRGNDLSSGRPEDGPERDERKEGIATVDLSAHPI